MKIKVTLGHIAKSTELCMRGGPRLLNCPIAVALKEATGKSITVHSMGLSYGWKYAPLPESAMDYVRQADANHQANAVNPAEFDLDVEGML